MAYTAIGSKNKTAVMKASKNGNNYFLLSFSDKATGRAYSIKVFANSTYVPTNSKKSFRNGATCCPCIITASKYVKSAPNGGWNNRSGYGNSGNDSVPF